MKIKQKPSPPQPYTYYDSVFDVLEILDSYKYIPLDEVIEKLKKQGTNLFIKYEIHGNWDDSYADIKLYKSVTKEPTKTDWDRYNKKLKAYNNWYEKNKIAIEEHYKQKEEQKKENAFRRKKEEINNLIEAKIEIEKKLAKLNK